MVFWDQLCARSAGLPGVLDAAVTTKLPFDGGVSTTVLIGEEPFDSAQRQHWVEVSYVSPSFFPAIGASIHQGRLLGDADARARHQAVVINRAMAERVLAWSEPHRPADSAGGEGVDVVGHSGRCDRGSPSGRRDASQARDVFPVWRLAGGGGLPCRPHVPGVVPPVQAIREELRHLDPDLALAGARTMADRYGETSRVFTTITGVVDGLSIAVLGLAAMGLYGTLSFFLEQRQREIGVRLALGADGRDIALLVLRQAFVWIAVGGGIGLAFYSAMGMALRAGLQDASPVNVGQLFGSVAVVTATALVAVYWPARRAARIDPMAALRCE